MVENPRIDGLLLLDLPTRFFFDRSDGRLKHIRISRWMSKRWSPQSSSEILILSYRCWSYGRTRIAEGEKRVEHRK